MSISLHHIFPVLDIRMSKRLFVFVNTVPIRGVESYRFLGILFAFKCLISVMSVQYAVLYTVIDMVLQSDLVLLTLQLLFYQTGFGANFLFDLRL